MKIFSERKPVNGSISSFCTNRILYGPSP